MSGTELSGYEKGLCVIGLGLLKENLDEVQGQLGGNHAIIQIREDAIDDLIERFSTAGEEN